VESFPAVAKILSLLCCSFSMMLSIRTRRRGGGGTGEGGMLREQKVKRDGKTIVKIKRQRSARGKGSAHVYFHQILGPDMSSDLGEIKRRRPLY
jgi:hypothetical protein